MSTGHRLHPVCQLGRRRGWSRGQRCQRGRGGQGVFLGTIQFTACSIQNRGQCPAMCVVSIGDCWATGVPARPAAQACGLPPTPHPTPQHTKVRFFASITPPLNTFIHTSIHTSVFTSPYSLSQKILLWPPQAFRFFSHERLPPSALWRACTHALLSLQPRSQPHMQMQALQPLSHPPPTLQGSSIVAWWRSSVVRCYHSAVVPN